MESVAEHSKKFEDIVEFERDCLRELRKHSQRWLISWECKPGN